MIMQILLKPSSRGLVLTPTSEVVLDDYLGATRGYVPVGEDISEPNVYVLSAPKSYAWCTLVVKAQAAAEIMISMSSPADISNGAGIWVPWNNSETENQVEAGTPKMFTWEWPLVAIGIKTMGAFNYEMAHKII
jgi:hypothetical protein